MGWTKYFLGKNADINIQVQSAGGEGDVDVVQCTHYPTDFSRGLWVDGLDDLAPILPGVI